MEQMKKHLERQLIANVVKDKCAHCADVLFEEAWCTQERCIRFTLPIFRALFPPKQGSGWDSGDFLMFEVNNNADNFAIFCRITSARFPKEYAIDRKTLLSAFAAAGEVLWQSKCASTVPSDIFAFFDDFLANVLPDLQQKILGTFITPVREEALEEGAVKQVTSTRYERNRKARELCLAYHGKACRRCGIDFERDYGAAYADLIEVHHVVPISEIKEAYIVDPIKDLIPLCPNCHAMTHCDIKQKGD